MAENNRNREGQQKNRGNVTGPGSGQQTGSKRPGQKQEKKEEHYRSGDQKKQRGNHGGNR